MTKLSYAQRAQYCTHPLAKRLLLLMQEKQTNLALSADLTRAEDILQLAESVGPNICVLKTHVDIIEDFSLQFIQQLTALAEKHRFLLFEDRKFADIGNTVRLQYSKGIYQIADWADITNAYVTPGPGVIQGLQSVGQEKGRGLLLIGELSSKDNIANGDYTNYAIKLAEQFPEFVMGFITQHRLTDNPQFIHMTPGVKLQASDDALGQQYNTPENAIVKNDADIIIVGRGIYEAPNPKQVAQTYQQTAWQLYLNKTQQLDNVSEIK